MLDTSHHSLAFVTLDPPAGVNQQSTLSSVILVHGGSHLRPSSTRQGKHQQQE